MYGEPGTDITAVDAYIIALKGVYDPTGYITLTIACLIAGTVLFMLWKAPKGEF